MARCTFGPFLLDPEARLLLREGELVPMAGKTLDTLLLLVQNRGRLLDKDELLSRIWAGSVVEEANLTQSISTVRKVLGDSPRDHRYIATVAGRGYQFVAPVTEVHEQAARKTSARQPFWVRHRLLAPFALAALLTVGLAALIWFTLRQPVRPPTEPVEQQLTFNSGASAIESAALSGDGNYLAYTDLAGIHVRLLATGEERMLDMPAGLSAPGLSSYVDSWFPDGTQLLMDSWQAGGPGSTWTISLIGQSPRELRTDSKGWSVSPDGSLVAFTPHSNHRELWLMNSQGGGAKRIVELAANEWLGFARWSPDGRWLAYIRGRVKDLVIESCDRQGADRTVLLTVPKSDYWLADLCWLSDKRIVYALQEDYGRASSLWQVAVDRDSGRAAGKEGRITRWIGSGLLGLSASADGKRLVLHKGQIRTHAYIAELTAGGKRMNAPRLLSSNEAEDSPTAWTADSKSVLFASDRNGKWGLFKQAISETSAEPLITGPDFINLARLSPDGASVLYTANSGSGVDAQLRVMRVSVKGGLPQFVFDPRKDVFDFSCARAPANFCVAIEGSDDPKQLVLTAIDPMKGRGKRLRTTPNGYFASGLAPDGTSFAIAQRERAETHIKLLSLVGRSDREIVLKNWPRIAGLDWAADSKGLFCGFTSPRGGTLVYVELNGTTHVLWHSNEVGVNAFLGGIPSPDESYLAIWVVYAAITFGCSRVFEKSIL